MNNRFQKTNERIRWEGAIFTGVEFSDSRISILDAKPCAELSDYIEAIWYMDWNIEDPEGMQCIVAPNPCTKFIILKRDNVTYNPLLIGAHESAEIFTYTGQGSVVGIDFRPGALYPFINRPMNDWPAIGLSANEVLPNIPLPGDKWDGENLSEWLSSFEDHLLKLLVNSKDHNYKHILSSIEGILDESLQSTEEIAKLCNMSVRTLQRIFKNEVGVTPRDVLRIARFNRSIRQISENDFASFADVALTSGFFDQPHMVNEFQKLVATPPSKFRRYL
jgi:AraC-like DNA-binding protein